MLTAAFLVIFINVLGSYEVSESAHIVSPVFPVVYLSFAWPSNVTRKEATQNRNVSVPDDP